MRELIEQLREDPAGLEALYRRAVQEGREPEYRAALAHCAEASPDDLVLRAWVYRLDPDGATAKRHTGAAAAAGSRRRHWTAALGTGVVCGVLFAVFAGGRLPVPVPGEAEPLFWIGWAPLAAIAVVVFDALAAGERERYRWHAYAAGAAVLAGAASALVAWGRADDVAILVALHLPLVAWALIGGAVTLGRPRCARELYAYALQSLEVLVTGGIFVGAGVVFGALTVGIFEVLGIEFPDSVLRAVAAFGIGVVPVLAVASVHDPSAPPTRQSPTGIARILRIVTWLLLPVALGVLALYVLWFVPTHFWRPFEERAVLIVYNVTILAVLVLVAAAVSAVTDDGESVSQHLLRRAVVALTGLTLLLDLYALGANLYRTVELGVTPNRHAVLGWNVVTLAVLASLLVSSRTGTDDDWPTVFRAAIGRAILPVVAWASWVLWVLPMT